MTNNFTELGVDSDIVAALQKQNITTPTEIQAKTIPLALEGKDILAGSATGSGKTLAFGLGFLQKVHKGAGIQALILTPTRELADQIQDNLKEVTRQRKLLITTVYGGVSINPQIKVLKSADIVVGTPGRILDHLRQGTIDLNVVTHVVLDEADRMLDMGFLDDVSQIISQCKKADKQMLLFSATLPPEIAKLSKKFMKDPVKVNAVKHVDPKKLNQVYYDVASPLKFSLLAHLLKKEDTGLVMVFCNSRQYTDVVANNLNKIGIEAMAIHGGLTQQKRSRVLEKFNSKTTFVLVCTDVAARGLDIDGVSHVYNYDIPNDSKQYVHRIGRTARAGKSGEVINLISNRDYDNFDKVLRDNGLTIKRMEKPYIERIEVSQSPSDGARQGGFGGRSGQGRGGSRGGSRGGQGRGRGGPSGRSSGSRGGSRGGNRSGGSREGSSREGSSRGGSRGNGRQGSGNYKKGSSKGNTRSPKNFGASRGRKPSASSGNSTYYGATGDGRA